MTKIYNRLAQIENRERVLNKELDVVHEKNLALFSEILRSKEFSIPIPMGSLWEGNYNDAIDTFFAIYGCLYKKAVATSIDEMKQIEKGFRQRFILMNYLV